MKSIFLTLTVVACFAIIYGEERMPRNEQFLAELAECTAKVGASDSDVKLVVGRQKLTTKASQCLMACIKKKSGAMTADNKLDFNKAKENLLPMKAQSEEMYNKMIKWVKECKDQETTETDDCEAARKFSDCMHTQRSKA